MPQLLKVAPLTYTFLTKSADAEAMVGAGAGKVFNFVIVAGWSKEHAQVKGLF
jgi:hypothetical protein